MSESNVLQKLKCFSLFFYRKIEKVAAPKSFKFQKLFSNLLTKFDIKSQLLARARILYMTCGS